MPLTRSVNNPNYFATPDGKPVYLTGSHHWNSLQDEGKTSPPAAFDYTGYVNWMEDNNYNFMRLWNIAEQPYSAAWTTSPWYTDPLPYVRTDGSFGNAADGKPKFDVNTFNQDYFDRLRERVIEAGEHGIYVDVMLFEGWSLGPITGSTNPWTYHPFNKNNNINGINGDPSNTGSGYGIQTTSEPAAVLTAQQAYVRKVIDTVNDLDNVVYEISNEFPASSTQWQYNMINYIKNYEAGKPKQHPVGMTQNDTDNSVLFNSPADWVSPGTRGGGYKDNPTANNGSKVVLNDTDHLWGLGGDATWVWKSFTRGLNPIFMDDLAYTGVEAGDVVYPPASASVYTVRTGMTETANYAERMDLVNDKPHGELSSTGYMLANPGAQYLAFAPNGGSFTVNLSAGSGSSFSAEWLNVYTADVVIGDSVDGGSSSVKFTPPFSGAAVLFLNKLSGVTVSIGLVSDTGSSATDKITSNPAIKGTGQASTVVTIKEGGTTLGTTTADSTGAWSYTPAGLAEGTHTLAATQTDLVGNTGTATLSFMLDRVPPAVSMALVSDTGSSATDKITSNPAIKGTGQASTVVTIKEGSTTLGTTTADGTGVWSYTPTGFVDGVHTLSAFQTDPAGNTGTATLSFTLAKTAPTVSIALVSDTGSSATDKITSNPAIKGTGQASTVVTIEEGGTTLGTTTADSTGAWSYTPAGLAEGTHMLAATQTDLVGNTGTATLSFMLDRVPPAVSMALVSDTGSSATDKITSNPAIKGTGQASTVVTIKEGSTTLGTTTADGTGVWSYTPTGFVDGVHTLSAFQTDPAGNTGTATLSFTLAKTAPTVSIALVSDTGSSATDKITSNPAIKGTGQASTVVTIKEGGTTLGTTTADSTGAWSYTPAGLAEGTHTLAATQTDLVGNTGTATLSFMLDAHVLFGVA